MITYCVVLYGLQSNQQHLRLCKILFLSAKHTLLLNQCLSKYLCTAKHTRNPYPVRERVIAPEKDLGKGIIRGKEVGRRFRCGGGSF